MNIEARVERLERMVKWLLLAVVCLVLSLSLLGVALTIHH
jgi:hypothetical protein